MKLKHLGVSMGALLCAFAHAASEQTEWVALGEAPERVRAVVQSQAYLSRTFRLNGAQMRARLARALPESAMRGAGAGVGGIAAAIAQESVIDIPMPDGSTERFTLFEVPVMEPELAAAYPFIKAYAGESLEVPGAQVRLTMTARGFHAMILSPKGDVFVNPADAMPSDRTEEYVSFRLEDAADQGVFECAVLEGESGIGEETGSIASTINLRGSILNTLTLAFVPTAEWSILHGGTKEMAVSALAEHASRISAIYEREMCVRFILTNRQADLVQLDPVTDGLSNSDATAMMGEGAAVINKLTPGLVAQARQAIGTYGGGVASLNSICSTSVSTANSAVSIDYPYTTMVACHELGHMCGASHTFSGYGERCGPNFMIAVEPGSGSTIMSYARQCWPDNIVPESDLMFHGRSLREMSVPTNCGTFALTGNAYPTVALPPEWTGSEFWVPPNTPILLPAVASDANGDAVTLAWDQADFGQRASLASGDAGNNAIFRSWLPRSELQRVIPAWDKLLSGMPSVGETLPTTNRTITIAMVARDNRLGGGALRYSDYQLACATAGGPFRVLSPNDGLARSAGPLLVTWNKAQTDLSPFLRANVRISLMRNDADRNPLVLIASAPNDGSEVVDLPEMDLAAARIMVQPVGAMFFDVSRKPFAVLPRSEGANVRVAGPARISDTFANGNGNGIPEAGEDRLRVYLPVVNTGHLEAGDVWGHLESHTPGVSVMVADATWDALASGAGAENATAFVIGVAPEYSCGEPAELEFTIHYGDSGLEVGTESVAIGRSDVLSQPQTISYAGPAAAIPDGDAAGVSVELNVGSLPGIVKDVKFRIDGTASTDMNSSEVGLNHPYVGDLVLELTNPTGTKIQLADRPGGIGNYGHNFAATLFDMTQVVSYMQYESVRRAPYDGVFFPKDDLNLLAGGSAEGTWTLRVADMRIGEWPEAHPTLAPAVRRFSLLLTCLLPPQCAAPKPYCEGDFTLDGVVDDADFSVFVVAYNELFNAAGDLDGDTLTTDADFSLFVRGYDELVCP